MNSQNFKGFIYQDGSIVNFDFDIEHAAKITELDKQIENGGIRMCLAVEFSTIGITIYELTSDILSKITSYLRRHRLLNESIGIEIIKTDNFLSFDNYSKLNLIQL